jgi:hypothetical protein
MGYRDGQSAEATFNPMETNNGWRISNLG